jgi:hypothetical protein
MAFHNEHEYKPWLTQGIQGRLAERGLWGSVNSAVNRSRAWETSKAPPQPASLSCRAVATSHINNYRSNLPFGSIMLLRPTLRLVAPAFRLVRPYSSDAAAAGPLIRVTNLPAPNTGHIRVLELNRPSARNAISKSLLAALRAEIDDVHSQYTPEGDEKPAPPRFGGAAGADERGPTRALILASAVDASFCAGADLKERRGFTQEE